MAQPGSKILSALARAEQAARVQIRMGLISAQGADQPAADGDGGVTMLDIGYLAEYGREQAPRVPARRPLGVTSDREGRGWVKTAANLLQLYIDRGEDAPLIVLGAKMTGDVRASIDARLTPALSEFTIANRKNGGDVPFKDTGGFQRSFKAEIVMPDGSVRVAS